MAHARHVPSQGYTERKHHGCKCSYRDLPLRLAEFGTVYRFEQSGELNGLLRTRDFTVDDSHIFLASEQVEDEFIRVIELALFVFRALHLSDFTARVGLRDPASSKFALRRGSDRGMSTTSPRSMPLCRLKLGTSGCAPAPSK